MFVVAPDIAVHPVDPSVLDSHEYAGLPKPPVTVAVNVTISFTQTSALLIDTSTVASGRTVMVTSAVPEHPMASVTVTENVESVVGFTIITALVAPVLQL